MNRTVLFFDHFAAEVELVGVDWLIAENLVSSSFHLRSSQRTDSHQTCSKILSKEFRKAYALI